MTDSKYSLTWDLDSLLPHPESDEFKSALSQLAADLERLAEQSAELPVASADVEAVDAWTQTLSLFEDVMTRLNDVGSFIGCHAAADAENKLFQQIEGQLAAMHPLVSRATTDIEFGLKECNDDAFAAFVEAGPELQSVRFFLEDQRKNAAMRLPKEMESLAADLDVDGKHAWGRLYDRVSSEIRVKVMEKGEVIEKSPGQVAWDSAERTVRENNFRAANKAWDSIADTCSDAINHIAGARLSKYRRLDVSDHLDAPLRFNRLRRESLDTMWATISERKDVLKRYFDAKAQLLGIEKLAWFDLQAPVPGPAGGGNKISYDDACDLIIDTMGKFSPHFGDFCKKAIEQQWIEAEDRSGKRQGGFCTYLPTKGESRIFMTFTNTQDSMSTLAHELGHAYHSFVLKDQPRLLQD